MSNVHSTPAPPQESARLQARIAALEREVQDLRHRETAIAEDSTLRKLLFEQSKDGFVVLDAQGKVVELNPASAEMLGYTLAEARQLHVWDWDAQWTREEVMEKLRQLGTSRTTFETRHRRKDGTCYPVEVSRCGFQWGGQTLVYSTHRDITVRKQAEELRTVSEQSYKELFNAIGDAVYLHDAEGRFLDVNDGAVAMYGYPKEYFLGKTPEFLSAPGRNDPAATMAAIQRALAGEPQRFEWWGLRKNGEVFPKEVRLERGTYFGKEVVVAVARDTTEEKRVAEEMNASRTAALNLMEDAIEAREHANLLNRALRESEERLSLALEGGELATWDWNLVTGRVVYSERWAALLGCGSAEIEPHISSWEERLHPEDLPRVKEVLNRHLQGQTPAYESEHRLRHKSGDWIWVLDKGKVIERDALGRPLRACGTDQDITARKQAEAALRESEDRYRLLVEESPDAIGIYQDGTLVFVNSTGVRQLGAKTKAELLGVKSRQIIHPDDRAAAADRVRRRLVGEMDVYPAEVRYVRLDGTVIPMEVSATPVLFGGKPAVQAIARDITERKRAEAQLRILSRAVEQSPASVVITDTTGRIEYVNPKFTQLTGYSFQEALGQNPRILKSGEQPKEYYRQLWKTITAGGEWHGVFHNRKKNGELFWEAAAISPIVDAAGKITHFLAVKEDIGERKRAEERIAEQAALLDAANDAIYVRTLDHTVTYWNSGAERLYGWSRAEALGRKIIEMGDVEHEAFEAAHAALLEHGSWSGELKKLSKTGKEFIVFCRWTLLRNEQGQARAILAINTDITETRKLETQFLRAQRLEAIGALAGGIAHDLNNILAPILMIAPLLRETAPDSESRAMLDTMETCARRGADIIKQLLTFARGKPGARVPLPMRHLLLEMEKIIRETFPRNIQPRVNTAEDLWLVLGDATQVHQALMNLCVNARDAMSDGGTLTLSPENVTVDEAFAEVAPDVKPGDYVRLSVTDTGTGITPEHLDRIFDPFFTTKEIGKGTGLGLATVLGIVRGHGGFVRVNSLLGQGTTFDLYFPASREEKPASLGDQAPPPPRSQGELILVVDDEPGVRNVIQHTLEKQGYQVVTAAEGREALALFTQHRAKIEAVVTDMMMPGMDGPSLVRALQEMDPRLPLIGMTGLAERASVKGLESLDLSVLLIKPFVGGELLTALHEALAEPHSAADEKT